MLETKKFHSKISSTFYNTEVPNIDKTNNPPSLSHRNQAHRHALARHKMGGNPEEMFTMQKQRLKVAMLANHKCIWESELIWGRLTFFVTGSWMNALSLIAAKNVPPPHRITHLYTRSGTSLFPSLFVTMSLLTLIVVPQLSLARRSNTSLLYTSTTETSTQWLAGGFSEISLRGGKNKKQPKRKRKKTPA